MADLGLHSNPFGVKPMLFVNTAIWPLIPCHL